MSINPTKELLMKLKIFLSLLLFPLFVHAHCQVPCGVYTDEMRFQMIEEDLQTIEKAMTKITELSAAEKPDYALITRWTNTKEEHASKIQTIVSEYFMTQRIKADATQYGEKIKTLHAMLISAMKCKQTVDESHVAESRRLAKVFHGLYIGKAAHDHSAPGHKH